MDVSIIIVSFNTCELTKNCLHSIFNNTKELEFEVIVSDNGSTDGSITMIKNDFPSVILLENSENIGFGRANNKGLKVATGKYILYLNSDTILLNNAVKYFFDYWESYGDRDHIGALGTILVDEKLTPIHSGGAFPKYEDILQEAKAINKRHIKASIIKLLHISFLLQLKHFFYHPIVNVKQNYGNIDYVTGADLFLLNNKDAYFDEDFFLYYEETDLQLQIAKKGMNRILIDGPRIMHLVNKGSSKKYDVTNFSTIQCQISEIRYSKKNLTKNTTELFKLIMKDWNNPYIKRKVEDFKDLLRKVNNL